MFLEEDPQKIQKWNVYGRRRLFKMELKTGKNQKGRS